MKNTNTTGTVHGWGKPRQSTGGRGISSGPSGPVAASDPRVRAAAPHKKRQAQKPAPKVSLAVRIDRLAVAHRKANPTLTFEEARREVIRSNPEIRQAMIDQANPRHAAESAPLKRTAPARGWIAAYNKLILQHTVCGRSASQARAAVKRDNPLAYRRYLAAKNYGAMDDQRWIAEYRDVLI